MKKKRDKSLLKPLKGFTFMNHRNKKNSDRAEHFKETRNNRQNEIAEDYTELIDDLVKNSGQARVCDISREMGISHVSVLKTLRKLKRDGYIKEDSQSIELTSKGIEMAAFSKKKHMILSKFLSKLGVPDHIAATDVEGIEHHISSITLNAIDTFMKERMH